MGITLDKARNAEGLEVLRNFEQAYEAQRIANNAINKAKTKARNFVTSIIASENLPATTVIECDGVKYHFGAHVADKLDPKQWYALWKKGEITEDQYFEAIDVTKSAAEIAIGKDQCNAITVQRVGKENDIRRDATEAGHRKGLVIIPPALPKGIAKRAKPLEAPISKTRKLILRGGKK